MNAITIQKETKRSLKAAAPAVALANFKAFYSASPSAFEAKAPNLPKEEKTAIFVVDVLRATTSWTAIGAADPHGIRIEVKSKEGAGLPTSSYPDRDWVCAGEWDGKPINGGAMGNSPTEVMPDLFYHRWVRFESTNGARAVAQATTIKGAEIYIVCFPNIEAAVEAAIEDGCGVFAVAAGGFYGAATLEDTACAGRIFQELIDRDAISFGDLDDEAHIAVATANALADDRDLLAMLKRAQVARLLAEVGRESDVDAVINGSGIYPQIWARMHSTVLRYCEHDGLGVFVSSNRSEVA